MNVLRNNLKSSAGLLLAAAALCGTAAAATAPDPVFAPWLGKEIAIASSTLADHIPVGGKLTLVYDSEDDVVRVCTRSVPARRAIWRMDLAVPCNVALNFVLGTRFCSQQDVKAGDAETLSTCHRLRSHDVAMHPAAEKGAVELHDVIVFLIQDPETSMRSLSIVLDSPSRVTHGGTATSDHV
jgi:hypothetical protein